VKRKNGNPSLRSVTRVRDPRFPGISIRVTELKRDGPLFAARQVNGKPRYQKLTPEVTWISLGATEKARQQKATALALDLIERIATEPDDEGEPSGPDLTLGGLIKKFETDGLHGRPARYRNGMLTSIRRVRDYLGADLAVKDLKPSHVQKWMAHRSGVLVAGKADLVALSIVINWGSGEGLLDANPLATKMARKAMRVEHQPRRPVATRERYEQLKGTAAKLPPAFGVLLDLAWHAGHRISAMLGARDGEFSGLRWRDVSFKATEDAPHGAITWYAGVRSDRKKHEHTVQMNKQASATLARWQKQTGGVGAAFVFSHPHDRTTPLSYYDAKRWLKRAEVKAGLAHEKQGGWHALRRGWATMRKAMPIQDVALVGGWLDTMTVGEVYQQPDAKTTRRVALHVA
jgi:integrase